MEPSSSITYSNSHLNPALNLIKYPKSYLKIEQVIENLDKLLNRRVEVSESTGTIKYIGKLKHLKDKKDDDFWIGIEWDDFSRGKHNGTVEGFEYFKTSHPTSGSLIKFNKVNFGNSFLEAIKFKYNFHSQSGDEMYQFLNRAVESDLYIQANKKRITIELVGKEKAIQKFSQLDAIRNIDLAFSFVSEIETNLSSHFPQLKELILQKTLLNKWSQFLLILQNFKNLEILNFSENFLLFDDKFEEIKNSINPNELKLNYLILNKCNLDFSSFYNISFVMRNVETLYLMGNEINEENFNKNKSEDSNNIQYEKEKLGFNLSKLSFISLERNKIKNFIKTLDLLCIHKVSRINLNQNHISKIIYNEEEDLKTINEIKPNLQGLYIDYNQFSPSSSETQILKELSFFENLTDLDILNNNLIEKIGIDISKNILIGRLLKLQTLNNTSISKDVRRDCELFYLKNSVNDYLKFNPVKESFDKAKFEEFMKLNHPNYFILKKKYFDPLEDILENVKQVDLNTIKGNIIEVNFKHGDKQITKKFHKTTTFSNLRNLLSKLFKINGNFSFNINLEEVVTDETRSLDNCSVNSSHIIYLN